MIEQGGIGRAQSWLPWDAVPPSVVTLPDSPAGRDKIFLLAGGFELVNSAAAVFHDVKIIPRIHGDTVSLIELAGQVSDLTHTRHDLARLAVDDIDPRIVLVDDEHESLGWIT